MIGPWSWIGDLLKGTTDKGDREATWQSAVPQLK